MTLSGMIKTGFYLHHCNNKPPIKAILFRVILDCFAVLIEYYQRFMIEIRSDFIAYIDPIGLIGKRPVKTTKNNDGNEPKSIEKNLSHFSLKLLKNTHELWDFG
jgi:hypothetical protein